MRMIEQNRIDADNNSEIENRNESVKDKKQQKREKRNARLAKIKALFKRMLDAFDGALYPLDITCDACGNELVRTRGTGFARSVWRNCRLQKGIFV